MPAMRCGSLRPLTTRRGAAVLLAVSLGVPAHAGAGELAACYEKYDLAAFENASCPSLCHYTMMCDSEATRVCIRPDDCGIFRPDALAIDEPAPGEEYLGPRCARVNSTGCGVYRNGTCQKCAAVGYNYDEAKGICIWDKEQTFLFICYGFGIVVLWILVDFCRAAWGPTRNPNVIREGVRARFRSQFRQLDKQNCPRYKVWDKFHRSLWDKEMGQPIGGPGLTMYMNWFCLVIPLSIWLWAGAFMFASPRADQPCQHAIPVEIAEVEAAGNTTISVSYSYSEEGRLSWAIWNYVGAVVMSAIFFIHQEKLWSRLMHQVRGDASMHRYCVELRGFPPDATDNEQVANFVKDELRHWLLPDSALVHVSIAFSYPRSDGPSISQALDANLRRAKRRYSVSEIPTEQTEVLDDVSRKPWGGPFWVRFTAWAMLGAPMATVCGSHGDEPVSDDDDLTYGFMSRISAAGTVFAVFETEPVAVAVCSIGTLHTRWFSDSDVNKEKPHKITSVSCDVDPASIRWHDYFRDTKARRWGRIWCGAFQLLLLLIVWTYIYALFTEFAVNTKYVESSWTVVMENMLGILIFFGNASLAYGVQGVTENIGFKKRQTLLLTQLLLVVPIVGLNTIVDLFIARTLAATHEANYEWLKTVTVDITYLFEPFDFRGYNPFSNDLQDELIALAPTYVALPYLMEPVGTVLLPLMIGIWRIKRDTRVTAEEAARWLMPPEVELVNPPYNDIVNVTNFVIYTFWVLPGHYHRTMFTYYIVFGVLLYAQMRVRVVHMQMYTFFGSNNLHVMTMYLWAIPLGIMAACVGKEMWGYDSELVSADFTASPRGFTQATTHMTFHILFVAFILPYFREKHEASDTTYHEETNGKPGEGAVALATYFNTNPIEVLRKEAAMRRENCRNEELPIFYRLDMAYLQPNANHTIVDEERYKAVFEDGLCWLCLSSSFRFAKRKKRSLQQRLINHREAGQHN